MAIVIPKTFGEGGAHLTSGDSSGLPDLKSILEELAEAVNGLTAGAAGPPATITAPALSPFSDPPTSAQMESLRTLVNQIRAALVA